MSLSCACSQDPLESDMEPIHRVKCQACLSHCSLSLSHSLSVSVSCVTISFGHHLSVSDPFTFSASCPGQARPRAWGDGQARRLLLVLHPHWQKAQSGCCSGIFQLPRSSHQAQAATSLSSPAHSVLSRTYWGRMGGGTRSCRAQVTGQPVLMALPSTSAAP